MTTTAQQHSIMPLEVSALGYAVDGRALIGDVSFSIPAGGVTMLLGANGAGKSLLLRLCYGLLEPSEGRVCWTGNGARSRHDRRHAMVFQKPVMLRRSARANIRHALWASPLRDEADQRTATALERFGLTHLAEHPARLLSGGEQQRLAIARASALTPECLFLDEPCSQLDPGATHRIEQMIAALAADGVTIVMSTHDLGQARRLGHRVLFLHRGQLIEDAPAERFFAGPATEAARAFLSGTLYW